MRKKLLKISSHPFLALSAARFYSVLYNAFPPLIGLGSGLSAWLRPYHTIAADLGTSSSTFLEGTGGGESGDKVKVKRRAFPFADLFCLAQHGT